MAIIVYGLTSYSSYRMLLAQEVTISIIHYCLTVMADGLGSADVATFIGGPNLQLRVA